MTASELHAEGAGAYGRLVRAGGRVVDGSIERDDRALTLRFAVTDGTARLPVVYRGVVPTCSATRGTATTRTSWSRGATRVRVRWRHSSPSSASHGALEEADVATGGTRAAR